MYMYMLYVTLQGAAKKWTLKYFAVFSATVGDFNMKFCSFTYLVKPSASNFQVKHDFVKKTTKLWTF